MCSGSLSQDRLLESGRITWLGPRVTQDQIPWPDPSGLLACSQLWGITTTTRHWEAHLLNQTRRCPPTPRSSQPFRLLPSYAHSLEETLCTQHAEPVPQPLSCLSTVSGWPEAPAVTLTLTLTLPYLACVGGLPLCSGAAGVNWPVGRHREDTGAAVAAAAVGQRKRFAGGAEWSGVIHAEVPKPFTKTTLGWQRKSGPQ